MNTAKVIVVTGFEPFGGDSYNPSQEVAQSLNGQQLALGKFEVKSFILPVDTQAAPLQLAEIFEKEQPSALISLGLASGRTDISLEQVAVNLKDWTKADNAGNIKTKEPIDPTGPANYPSRLPLTEIKTNLDQQAIPNHLSSDAGLYLCNQVMYCALRLIDSRHLNIPAGFIHLPATTELELPIQIQAIKVALEVTAHSL